MRRYLGPLAEHPLLVAGVLLVIAYVLFGDQLPHIDVEQLLEDIADSLGAWTYLLVSVLAFLETGAFVGLVFPGETAVIVAGAVAGQGETSIVLTIALVWFSAWAGDSVSFLLGGRLGREFILRHGARFKITPQRFERVEDYFASHGGKTILVGRFIGLVRALAPFIAGSSGMRYRSFLPYSVLGTGLWALAFSLLGYFLAESLDRAGQIAGTGALIFGVLVGLVVGTVLVVRFLRERRNRERAVAWMERRRWLVPVVALGRRLRPQARFVWKRLTPGGLGLELTTLLAALLVGLFVVVGYASVVGGDPGPTPGDTAAFDLADSLQASWIESLTKAFSVLGSAWVTIPIALIAAFVLAAGRHRGEAIVILVAVLITHVAVAGFQDIIARPRPGDALVDVSGYSYPSGNAANAIIYPWLALTATVRLRPGKVGAGLLITVAIAFAAAVGLSRVYLHANYLSDVSGGAGLGVAAFTACAAISMIVAHVRQNDGPDDPDPGGDRYPDGAGRGGGGDNAGHVHGPDPGSGG